MSEHQTLSYELADGILTPWLGQPDRLNAFTCGDIGKGVT